MARIFVVGVTAPDGCANPKTGNRKNKIVVASPRVKAIFIAYLHRFIKCPYSVLNGRTDRPASAPARGGSGRKVRLFKDGLDERCAPLS
jgi:hypothetical protein